MTYQRQLCWQTDGSGNVRVKYSPRLGFTAGGSANTTPTATDERVLLGSAIGTDASPTFAALFPTSGAWMQARFDEGTDAIWVLTYPVGGGAASSMFVLGILSPTYDSVGNLIDHDPVVLYAGAGTSSALAAPAASGGWASEKYGPMGLLAYLSSGGTSDAWVRLPATLRCAYDTTVALQPVLPGHLPQSPGYSPGPVYAQDTLRFGRRSELAGISTGNNESGNLNTCGDKGSETTIRFSGHTYTTPTLLNAVSPSNTSVTTGSLLGIGHLVLPWGGQAITDGA